MSTEANNNGEVVLEMQNTNGKVDATPAQTQNANPIAGKGVEAEETTTLKDALPVRPHIEGRGLTRTSTNTLEMIKQLTLGELISQRQSGERKPFHQKLYKTPKEMSMSLLTISENKMKLSYDKLFILSFIAGVFISFGGMAAITAAYESPGFLAGDQYNGLRKLIFAVCFHVALSFVIFFGAELFTSNTMVHTVALCDRKVKYLDYCIHLTVVYFGNFVGAVFAAGFFAYFAHLFSSPAAMAAVQSIAIDKTTAPPEALFLKAIACNWLVCLAVFTASSAETIEGKAVAVFLPISTFALVGFEHSIANMFYIPLSIMYGSPVNFGKFLYYNLILVTLGNYIGGAFFMGVIVWYIYVRGYPAPPARDKSASTIKIA